MPAFVALPASPDDIPHIVKVQFEANQADQAFGAVYPKGATPSSVSDLTRQYETVMDEDPTSYIMIVKEAMYGEIVAYAIWHFLPPHQPEDAEEQMIADIGTRSFPADANSTLGRALTQNSVRKRVEVATENFGPGAPYGYLAAFGTSPRFQRQGAASRLLEWATERADDKNLPVYIESTPLAVPLYEKFAFRECNRLKIDLQSSGTDELTHVCMIRFPNTS